MSNSTIRVLIIDDDPDDSLLIQDDLKDVINISYKVTCCYNYDDGLVALQSNQFDVATVDYRLGAKSGIDLVKAAYLQATSTTPIIFITGQGEHSVDVAAIKAGASDYIEKSKISSDILERSIRHSIEKQSIMLDLVRTNKKLELAWHHQEMLASHDTLTGLPNRTLLNDRLNNSIKRAKRQGGILGIMFIDLDQFKEINDSLGHSIGDRLLQTATKKITHCLRQCDTLARFGGDEFIVILNELNDKKDAIKVARKINEVMSQSIAIDGHKLFATASVGIATYPHDGITTDTLIKNADIAMYSAKQQGRNTWCLYEDIATGPNLEKDFHEHIQQNRFVLHYQPILDIKSRKIIGAEALVRWNHPELGFLSPDKFIPLAETTNLILPLGKWIISEACRQHKAWQNAGFEPIKMAVNLSPRQLEQEALINNVQQALQSCDMDAQWLTLEITENSFMRHPDLTINILHKLRDKGLKIALDDFGTGYSSLSYLRRLPIDTLKIDQSFVRDMLADPKDEAIVQAIIDLAKSLSLDIIAEGVETAEQESHLHKIECDSFQGYLFSKPVPAEEFSVLLATSPN
ncbi:MAG: EAL domain-containing protein [Gallionella sp.]